MEFKLTPKDKERIKGSIREKYKKVAVSPEGLFQYPTGTAGLTTLDYDSEFVRALSESVAATYWGWEILSGWVRFIKEKRCWMWDVEPV